ncbi:MAG: MliC family protein [Sphingomonas sp.]|jgi:membrane-bound inhibitor of C-type lysozyme|uniref:MliC family protein n=1 Tax=Sphingomonas sp. TaxID=28214 RepID=UPI00356866AA
MRYFVVLPLLLAAGCSPDKPVDNAVDINAAAEQAQGSVDAYANSQANETAPVAEAAPGAVATPAPLAPPEPGTPGGLPDDRTPISEAPFTPDSAQGAANVVQIYYALLGEGKYRQAWALWDDGGKASGMSADAFVASFAKYSEYHANIGAPGEIDAGAGQRYVTVPVQVYGRLKQSATPVYMLGSVTLHRVGDIDGATAAQKSWHIRSADIKPRPGGKATPVAGDAAPEVVTASYRCVDGSRLNVRFDNGADTATVRSGGKVLAVLKGQRPASGIWYAARGYELRGKGQDATFTQPKMPPLACRSNQ